MRGEPGWEIIPEVAPLPDEIVIDKPGKGSFVGTSLEMILQTKGIKNIIFAGVTTDVCGMFPSCVDASWGTNEYFSNLVFILLCTYKVHTTMRNANDMGYECLLLSDCCGATDPKNHDASISMIQKQGGVFGTVTTSAKLIESLSKYF